MKELVVSKQSIDVLYDQGSLDLDCSDICHENEYLILTSNSSSALVKVQDGFFTPIKSPKDFQGIHPKDSRQKCFYDSLKDEDILMTVALGKAGTGKTLLSVAFALHQYFKADKDIILIKPSVYVGGRSNVMGILPGDLNDKMSGIMSSYMVHIKTLLGRNAEHFIYQMLEEDKLKYLPVELARGMSLENATVIFDEAQNADIHTMKTIVSRVSSTSKLICLGDLGQIDASFRKKDSGLNIFIESKAFKDSPYTSQIQLKSQYRSVLADLCESITDEYYFNHKD
jgi:PhoH-like ATPase